MLKTLIAILLIQTAFGTFQDCDVDCSDKGTNGKIVESSNGEFYQIFCGADLYGNDIDNFGDMGFAGCIELCAQTENCVSVTFMENLSRCYLKGATGNITKKSESAAAAALISSIYIPAFEVDCDKKGTNGSMVTDKNGIAYKIYCDTNFNAGDLDGYPNLTFEECVSKCDLTDQCQSVTYTGHCYLKNSNITQKAKGQVSALRHHGCDMKWNALDEVCESTCTSPLVESDSEAGTKVCNPPCYEGLIWDVSNSKCVLECTDDQVKSSENGIKTCENKQFGCKLPSLVQKQKVMMRRSTKS